MKGTTNEKPLAEVLRDAHFDRVSGILHVHTDDRSDDLYLDGGEVFYCRSNAPAQKLSELLVRWGLVERDAVGGLLQRAGKDVKGALVREGVFPDETSFDDFMGRVLRERVLETLALAEATYELEEQDVAHLRTVGFPTSTPNLVLEAARRMPGAGRLLAPLKDAPQPLCVNDNPPVSLQSLHLSPQEGYVLSLVAGASAPAEVAQVSPLSEVETLRLLHGLLLLDVLHHPATAGYRFSLGAFSRERDAAARRQGDERSRIEAEYARVKSVDLFHLLPDSDGLDAGALRERLRAYQETWKPDAFSPEVAREMRDHLHVIASRAAEAMLAHVSPSRRAAEEESGDERFRIKRMELSKTEAQSREDDLQRRADESYRRGRTALQRRDFHQAVQFLRDAVRLHETAKHHAALAEALSENPHWIHRAEESYRRAMELNQFDARLPIALGRLYEKAGQIDKARASFERALEIQKDNEEASLALKALKRK